MLFGSCLLHAGVDLKSIVSPLPLQKNRPSVYYIIPSNI